MAFIFCMRLSFKSRSSVAGRSLIRCTGSEKWGSKVGVRLVVMDREMNKVGLLVLCNITVTGLRVTR